MARRSPGRSEVRIKIAKRLYGKKGLQMTMLKKEDIDWDKQARHFLEEHGWEIDENGLGGHELYPLMQDFSKRRFEEFCESFYGNAWEAYKAYIFGTVLMAEIEKEKVKSDD